MLIIAFRLLFIRQDDRHDHFCNLTTGRVIARRDGGPPGAGCTSPSVASSNSL